MENRAFWTDFLSLYQSLPCVWDIKSKDYKNRHKRNTSYDILLKKLQEISPNATLDILKKKLTNMKTCFKRELRKVRGSQATGYGSDSIYQPTLWYFDLMMFLNQGDESDDDPEFIKQEKIDYNMYEDEFIEQKPSSVKNSDLNDPLSPIGEPRTHHLALSSKRPLLNNSIGAHKVQVIDASHGDNSFRINDEDEFSVTGKRIGYQLKGMEEHQRLIAEKLISDVMYFGRMGKLKENASVECGKSNDS